MTRTTVLHAAVLGLALAAATATAQDDEPKPHPFVEAVKAAVKKCGGHAFLAEAKDGGKVEVSLWKDEKAWTCVVDAAAKKADDPKEAPKDGDVQDLGKQVGAALAKAKVDLAAAVEKALQREEKIDVDLAQALLREKTVTYVVQLKKGGVISNWEVDADSGKVSMQKAPGGAGGDAPK